MFAFLLRFSMVVMAVSSPHGPHDHVGQQKHRKAQQNPQADPVAPSRVGNDVQKDVAQETPRRQSLSQTQSRTVVTLTRGESRKQEKQNIRCEADQRR